MKLQKEYIIIISLYNKGEMPMNVYDELRKKYKDGYRCIYREKDSQNGLTIYLKDFISERTSKLNTRNDMEIGEIENFLDRLDQIKKKTGHDCNNTGGDE